MKAQYQKLIKELGGSEEEVKALLRKLVEKEILERMKEVLETIGKEERKAFQEEHEVRANGYYQRDLLTPMGAIEDLQVPRVRTGDFHPCFLEPHERHLFKLEELIYAMYAGGFCRTLEALLESKYSPQRVSRGNLPQSEEGGDSGRGSGLLSFGNQRGGIKGGAHLLPCFF